jgi:hypothetical protein
VVEPATRERLARLLLALLVVAFPLVYGLRAIFGARVVEPVSGRPAWIHLVLITCSRWPDPSAYPQGPALDSLARRGVRVGPVFAAGEHPATNAVSLWTGRHGANHGVLGPERALPFGAWTLAEGARRAGYRTAAFLTSPFATRQNLAGFEQVVESEGLDAARLADLARSFLTHHAHQRRLLWVHLEHPGSGGAAVEQVLAAVQGTLEDEGARVDTLTVLTALSGPDNAFGEGVARVPLRIELPTALNARRSSDAHLSQLDLTSLLRRLLRLANPDAGAGEAPLQGRAEPLWNAVRGGRANEWVWVELDAGPVLREPGQRELGLRVQADLTAVPPRYDVRQLQNASQLGESLPQAPEPVRRAGEQAFLARRAEVLSGATESIGALGR